MLSRSFIFFISTLAVWVSAATAADFDQEIEPILVDYCYDCHGDGMDKGDFAIDLYESIEKRGDYFENHDLWLKVWRNLRAGVMPPADKKQPSEDQKKAIAQWIESRVFKLDPKNPDPGRVTIRRLNRNEYQNTVYDLFGVRFNVNEEFPPDDTGYGFDTIGDVLSISPLLMEKYLLAADQIVDQMIPSEGGRIPIRSHSGKDIKKADDPKITAHWLEFKRERVVGGERWLPGTGEHEVELEYTVRGSEVSSEQTAKLELLVNGKVIKTEQLGREFNKNSKLKTRVPLQKGKQAFEIRITPLELPKEGEGELALQVVSLKFTGPLDGSLKEYSSTMQKIFFNGIAPPDAEGRRPYAREILKRQATRAFRRPIDEASLDQLVEIAMQADATPNTLFEEAIRQAMTAVIASPRFLFRAEIQPDPNDPNKTTRVDEFALASRLSYFLWSSAPDTELSELAGKNQLRNNLHSQIDRMLADRKSARFVNNFVGQWLQARDVETINIDARRLLKTKSLGDALGQFSVNLRKDMRKETETFFTHILKEDRPATELLTANYSFLNERLANWYNVKGVKGSDFQKVALKPENHRSGGLLTQGNFLVVSSNPTRTSPVKRGLFVLENFLASPPPPAPEDVPELEESKRSKEKLTMRQMMEVHREKPLCASCHKRMDPIGLALENYDPMGRFRDKEEGKPIDASGTLMTGETLSNAGDLAKILATARRKDFHRALAEKMLTYGLGRGIEYYDGPTIDKLVARMESEKDGGTLKDLIYGIVESAPFDKRRGDGSKLAAVKEKK